MSGVLTFRFLLAISTSGWTATRFVDTDNGIFLGLCIAAGLVTIGTLLEGHEAKIVAVLKESNDGDGRAR